jgi:hypothetical protein
MYISRVFTEAANRFFPADSSQNQGTAFLRSVKRLAVSSEEQILKMTR